MGRGSLPQRRSPGQGQEPPPDSCVGARAARPGPSRLPEGRSWGDTIHSVTLKAHVCVEQDEGATPRARLRCARGAGAAGAAGQGSGAAHPAALTRCNKCKRLIIFIFIFHF